MLVVKFWSEDWESAHPAEAAKRRRFVEGVLAMSRKRSLRSLCPQRESMRIDRVPQCALKYVGRIVEERRRRGIYDTVRL